MANPEHPSIIVRRHRRHGSAAIPLSLVYRPLKAPTPRRAPRRRMRADRTVGAREIAVLAVLRASPRSRARDLTVDGLTAHQVRLSLGILRENRKATMDRVGNNNVWTAV